MKNGVDWSTYLEIVWTHLNWLKQSIKIETIQNCLIWLKNLFIRQISLKEVPNSYNYRVLFLKI